ncbi:MAG: response regulator, partial [Candidatus Hydrogenedentes bacterium]|nr:response regulator [Candidatus Hydrogenedentota bacterium]
MQILVIDDDAGICRSLQIHLQHLGHEVDTAQTGNDGLQLLHNGHSAVAFVDLNLPDMSGLDILRNMKAEESETLAIMITGEQDAKATIEAIRLGAFDYIRKPLDLDAILASLAKAAEQIDYKTSKSVFQFAESDARPEIVGADPKIIEVLK